MYDVTCWRVGSNHGDVKHDDPHIEPLHIVAVCCLLLLQPFSPSSYYLMSASASALRRISLSTALPRARLITAHLTRPQFAAFSQSAPNMSKDQSRGQSTTGISEWKQRAPYKVHDKNENFDVKYEANCHCGKVKYQLSRREPLDSKLCHCTTCQTQHGMYFGLRYSFTR
jgi:hypothetical protein